MATIALEGVDATIAFGTSTHTADLLELTIGERTREMMETSHLGTARWMTFKESKHIDPGEVNAVFDLDLNMDQLIKATFQTITVTFPLADGETVPATLVFSGAASSEGGEVLKAKELVRKNVTFRVSGEPVFTAGS